ncbi:MAG TPA: CGNR zinc finger domain-containing protein [Bradyrhizobium sp.]|nr:CGNR zinc finger domain-containing protein [Bradyrhizobium sp.]
MTDPRPAPMFIADAHGLDFLNTIAAPLGSDIEWLGNGQDLLAWLERAGLIAADEANAIRAGTIPGELDAVAAQARALREWFRGFVLAHAGRSMKSGALAELTPLNRLLERDQAYGTIVAAEGPSQTPVETSHDHALGWRWRRRWRTPDMVLLPVAQAMANLVCEADFELVKKCEGPACTMLFLDTTKAHARRWCSMAVCGNRAKQASHRARARGTAARRPQSAQKRKE